VSEDEQRLREQFEEQIKNIRVEDVLVQTAVTLINLAARRLDEGDRDQSRLAIGGVRAIIPLCPEEVQEALREPLSQLQLVWAKPATAEGPSAGPSQEPEPPPKPESKLWTPGP
jgi:hypothetical protein